MIFVVVVLLLLPWISAGVTPVFILSYIRLTVLRESIRSYRKCLSDVELVVCDFGCHARRSRCSKMQTL